MPFSTPLTSMLPPLEGDLRWMRRCLELAERPGAAVEPNPRVGAVLVYGDKILAEGAHTGYGKAHAEVEALTALKRAMHEGRVSVEEAAGATLYVSLEPCNHQGKTPPCTKAILEAGIHKVVVGALDPHPLVQGRGLACLLQAGLEVRGPVLESACRRTNRHFEINCSQHRPYFTLKWAQSTDGFLDFGGTGPGPTLSSPLAGLHTHRLRREHSAILVGARTLLRDNPNLQAWRLGPPHPRVVVAADSRPLSPDLKVFQRTPAPLILPWDSWQEWPALLLEQGLGSVLVEGGAATLNAFLGHNLWDEIHCWTHPDLLAGKGTKAPSLPLGRMQSTHDPALSIVYPQRV